MFIYIFKWKKKKHLSDNFIKFEYIVSNFCCKSFRSN